MFEKIYVISLKYCLSKNFYLPRNLKKERLEENRKNLFSLKTWIT